MTLAASPNPANFGQTVTLTITVSPPSSTGTVTVFDSVTASPVGPPPGTTATLSNGTATITVSNLAVGSHSLQAFYSGPDNLTGKSNFVTETINVAPTTTTLTVSSTLLTATVTPSGATGSVTFKDGTTTLGTGTLTNGTATFTATTLATGSHTLTATYSGDGNFAPSTSNTVTITPGLTTTTTTLTVSPASSTVGQTVTLTAAVTPSTATGTVTFLDGSTTLGTATLSGGTATLTTAKLTSGTHTLTASYGGDSSNGPSTSNAVTETVGATKTVLTVSPNPATAGQTVTLTAASDAIHRYRNRDIPGWLRDLGNRDAQRRYGDLYHLQTGIRPPLADRLLRRRCQQRGEHVGRSYRDRECGHSGPDHHGQHPRGVRGRGLFADL